MKLLNRILVILLTASVLMGCGGEKISVLVLSENGGHHKPFTDEMVPWLQSQKNLEITVLQRPDAITKEFLKDFDVVLQLDFPPYSWPEEAAEAFEDYIDNGLGGWVGLHHASLLGEFDGYPMWQWFSGLLGDIRYENYIAELSDGTVIVEAPAHPVMAGVSGEFVIEDDEWYIYDVNPRGNPAVKVLASVDEDSYSVETACKMGDHPVVWTNTAKKARNIYIQFGHSPKLADNQDFLRLLTNAIAWTSEKDDIHDLIQPDLSASFEAEMLSAEILDEKLICEGPLEIEFTPETQKRAVGSPSDPDYATYGTYSVTGTFDALDASDYDLLVFDVLADCEGGNVCNLDVTFADAPTGSHLADLRNHEKNLCVLSITDYNRSDVGKIVFSVTDKGRGMAPGSHVNYVVTNVYLRKTSRPYPSKGWQPAAGKFIYPSGFTPEGSKTVIVSPECIGAEFSLEDSKGRRRLGGTVAGVESTLGTFGVIDLSPAAAGEYTLNCEGIGAAPVNISDSYYDRLALKMANFIYGMRCGFPVDGKHERCHTDLFADHNGQTVSYGGGWHDAGDLSQQTLQTGDVAFALLEAAQSVKDEGLRARLLDEARWGLEFVMNTRFGDGFRASSMGLLHWTDGQADTFDDIHSVRVQNHAFDNFLYAAYQAAGAMAFSEEEPVLSRRLRGCAVEDFAFAMEKFRKDGFDIYTQPYEHTYNTSPSQFYAAVAWSSAMMYKLTGDSEYIPFAEEAASQMLDCQQTEPVAGMAGFFWRDNSRKSVMHSIHQSREQLYMQALVALCREFPDSPHQPQWDAAIRLYSDYIKSLMRYTAPYGMIPSGIYFADEYKDAEAFSHLHIFAPADAAERYAKQLSQGVRLSENAFIKRFPVWFGIFNGNNAVLLSMGKNAALCGHYLGDNELLDIAREQIYWMTGKNPFAQSLVYGEGTGFTAFCNFSTGPLTGTVPVGIRTHADTDAPYWPHTSNACYKEAWVTVAGKVLSLLAE